MVMTSWGLLGSESLSSSRRTRTLGLGAAVRSFNDRAVPGLGGVWYAKQLVLALLGVQVAEQARARGGNVTNIQVANAIEAVACWLAYRSNGRARDWRLRGRLKLAGREDLSFRSMRESRSYVSQPMRTASVQPLPALGLVAASTTRFNGFRSTEVGQALLDEAFSGVRPYNRSLIDHLALWALGQYDRVNTDALANGLSPLGALPAPALKMLRDCLLRVGLGGAPEHGDRRRDALAWVESRRADPSSQASWETRPDAIRGDDHWRDLLAGARFFLARDAALAVLDAVEAQVPEAAGRLLDAALIQAVAGPLHALEAAARAFLDTGHPDQMARDFCHECVAAEPAAVLARLIERDGRVLRLLGGQVCPGPAFVGAAEIPPDGTTGTDEGETPDEVPAATGIAWPAGISGRIPNLFLLNLDLHGELGAWLDQANTEVNP